MAESAKVIDPLIEIRIKSVEDECDGRDSRSEAAMAEFRRISTANREQLIHIAGLDGRPGTLQVVQEVQIRHEARITAVERAVWKLLIAAAGGAGIAKGIESAIRAIGGG